MSNLPTETNQYGSLTRHSARVSSLCRSSRFKLASDALTTAVPFDALSSGSAVRFLSEEYSIVIHRNIRFLLSLMVNVKCRCRIKCHFTSDRGPASETL
jgi:hypothetical protein